jgi:glycosyltransferase involved in cell wall biosynthesis
MFFRPSSQLALNSCRQGSRQVLSPSKLRRPQQFTPGVVIFSPGGIEKGGGIGRQMGYFLKEQESKGLDAIYTVVDTRGQRFIDGSVIYTFLAIFYLALSVLRLLQARLFGGSGLAHINITGRGSTIRKIIVAMVARSVGLRYLLHVHDYNYAEEYSRRGALTRLLIHKTFRGAAKILVLGSRDQLALSALLGLPPSEITVLHNAVPDPQPAKSAPAKSAQPDDECRIVFLGNLSERKGVPELIRALASPALRAHRWRATLAGDGRVEEFRRLASELGIAGRIEFPGWVDQAGVRSACEMAEVLVLPSHAEGLAMSVLEGLSYGLAVIATPVGAHTEVIEPEVSGLFVPPGDVDALSAALARVIDDPALRARLGAGARRRFLEKFHVRGYAEQLERLHAAIM